MSWNRSPSTSLPRSERVREAAEQALQQGAQDLRFALSAGTPVDTGSMRDSWRVDGSGLDLTVEATVPYGRWVDIDTSSAAGVIASIDRDLSAAIDRTFGG
jgi:hypothetical protein